MLLGWERNRKLRYDLHLFSLSDPLLFKRTEQMSVSTPESFQNVQSFSLSPFALWIPYWAKILHSSNDQISLKLPKQRASEQREDFDERSLCALLSTQPHSGDQNMVHDLPSAEMIMVFDQPATTAANPTIITRAILLKQAALRPISRSQSRLLFLLTFSLRRSKSTHCCCIRKQLYRRRKLF